MGPPTSSHARKRRRRRRLKLLAVSLAGLVLSGSVVGYAGYQHYLGKITSVDVFGGLTGRPQALDDGATTFLLIGSDSRFGLSKADRAMYKTGSDEGERSDTMILVHLSKQRDQAQLVSLPRDSWVTIPEHQDAQGRQVAPRKSKLNGAYSLGGPALTVATIEQVTNLRIDHYLEVNFIGFARMVDALGGVDVCVAQPVNDSKSGLALAAGTTRVDGVQGLAYVRARKTLGDGSDLGRIERQQGFLGAMLREATGPGVLLNPLRLNGFLAAATESLRTDEELTGGQLRSLALKLRTLDPGSVTFATVPLADVNYTTPDGQSAVLWDEGGSAELFDAIRADEAVEVGKDAKAKPLTVTATDVVVEVANGTSTSGLAARTATELQALGFTVPGPAGNASTTSETRTRILYAPAQAEAARTLAASVKGALLVEDPSVASGVRLVLGSDLGKTVSLAGVKPKPPTTSASPKPTPKTAAQVSCA